MRKNHSVWAPVVLSFVVGCSGGGTESSPDSRGAEVVAENNEKLVVFTVNYPLQYFAQRLVGDLVEVSFPAPADEDPAYWAPGPEIIAQYQQADLILLNGVSYAKWLERATLPAGRLVDTSAAFEDRWIPLVEGPVHTHGPEGEHSHKGYAFTTWLDPQLAAEQARAVAAALAQAMPGHEAAIQTSLAALVADLQRLDGELELAAQSISDQPLLFSHPVYQYLTARYGLNAVSVHWEPEEQPSASQWEELESILASHPAKWMIWEGEPSPATVERLGDLGIQSVVYTPCGNSPETGDLLSTMSANAEALRSIGPRT